MNYDTKRDIANEAAEETLGLILRQNGFYTCPAQLLGRHDPALALRPTSNDRSHSIPDFKERPNIVEPDYFAFKNGTASYFEVKAKKPFIGSLTMNDYTFHHLVEIETASGIPAFYVVYRTDIAKVNAREPKAFFICPVSTLHAELPPLRMNNDGSAFYAWPASLFRPLAEHLGDPADRHHVHVPPNSPLGPYIASQPSERRSPSL